MRARHGIVIGIILALVMVIALVAVLTRDGQAKLQGTAFWEVQQQDMFIGMMDQLPGDATAEVTAGDIGQSVPPTIEQTSTSEPTQPPTQEPPTNTSVPASETPTVEPPATASPTPTAEIVTLDTDAGAQPQAAIAAEVVESPTEPGAAPMASTCAAQARYLTPSGVLPVTIEWSVAASSDVTGFQWIFHDGSTSTSPTTTFTYTSEGTFPVRLICSGPSGPIEVTSSVTITSATTGGFQIITVTPSPTPTTTLTRTPSLSPTPRPTNTPSLTATDGPSPTPTNTNTPRPTRTATNTNTPGPSPTPTPSATATDTATITLTPSETPVTDCQIVVTPDPNTPGAFTFSVIGSNVDNVNWNIDGTLTGGSTVFVQFTELGVMQIDVDCGGAGGAVRRTVFLRVDVTTSINTGSGGLILGTFTPTVTPTPTPTVTPTFTPTNTEPPYFPPTNTPAPPPPLPTATPTIPVTALPTRPASVAQRITPIPLTLTPGIPGWQPIEASGTDCVDWIAYHTNRTGTLNIFRLGELPEGETGDVNLTRGEGTEVLSLSPSISPDRQWITFTSDRDGDMEIYVSAVTGADIRRISFAEGADTNPVWSPNGRFIAYESNRDNDRELYLFDLETGRTTRLTDSPGFDINVSWAPNADRLAFQTNRDGRWQLYELTIANRTVRRLSDGTADDYEPVYAHDGTHIAFHSDRDSASALYIMDADGTDIVGISDPGGYAMSHTWSADDTLVAYQSDLRGVDQIYVYEVATGQTRRVTGDEETVDTVRSYAPSWYCSDSASVVFTSDALGPSDIFSAATYPLDAPAINVADQALDLTNADSEDGYPHGLVASDDHLGREINMDMLEPQ